MPEIVTEFPPAGEPLVGLIVVIVGAGVTYVYVTAFDVPPLVATVTLTAPAAPAGAVTVSEVADAAVTVAHSTRSRPCHRTPWTELGPRDRHRVPARGRTAPRADRRDRRSRRDVRVPDRVRRPAARRDRHVDRTRRPAGAVTVSEVADADVTVAVLAPNLTVSLDAVALKFVPVIVTEFPPAVEPLVGLTVVIAGPA